MKQLLILFCLTQLLSCELKQNKNTLTNISTIPSFNIQLLDSETIFNSSSIPSGNPIVIIYFRPDCPHCRQETASFISKMRELQNYQMYFLTGAELPEIKGFAKEFDLGKYKNIIVGKDDEHLFKKTYRPSTIPYAAIYDKNKKLVKIYEEEISAEKLINIFHS